MSHLIRGVNPMAISHIEARKFRRFGTHPYYTKLAIKRWGWFYNAHYDYDIVYPARVIIRGSDGSDLKTIPCKSNAEAYKLKDQLVSELNSFLDRITS